MLFKYIPKSTRPLPGREAAFTTKSISLRERLELGEEAEIAFVEHADVVQAVF